MRLILEESEHALSVQDLNEFEKKSACHYQQPLKSFI